MKATKNGWANYNTYRVAFLLENTRLNCKVNDVIRECMTEDSTDDEIVKMVKNFAEANINKLFLDDVDWLSIGQHLIDEVEL